MRGNESLYTSLQSQGFVCIFKPTLEFLDGSVKGNVDAELVLWSMIKYKEYDKALIVTGDGDFFCLAEYLLENKKLLKVLIPNQLQYSGLLKRLSTPCNNILDFVSQLRAKLEYKPNEKGSRRDRTL